MRSSRAGAALLALTVAATTACSIDLSAEHYIGKEEKSFAVTGKPELALKTFDGSIEVTTWDKPQVGVTIERRAGSQAEAEALKVTADRTATASCVRRCSPRRGRAGRMASRPFRAVRRVGAEEHRSRAPRAATARLR